MSVITTSDEKRDEAKEHISNALECLMVVLDKDTYGNSAYNSKYLNKIQDVAIKLNKLNRKI